jgi:hypothetical protein
VLTKRGRPQLLPDFNPEIPTIVKQQHAHLLPAIEKAVNQTLNKQEYPNHRFGWLKLQHKVFKSIFVLRGNPKHEPTQLTDEEVELLKWIDKGGKHDWSPAQKAATEKKRYDAAKAYIDGHIKNLNEIVERPKRKAK